MKTTKAEAHVLDRILHLLEEGSVRHLVEADEHFARYIETLYDGLHDKSVSLHATKQLA